MILKIKRNNIKIYWRDIVNNFKLLFKIIAYNYKKRIKKLLNLNKIVKLGWTSCNSIAKLFKNTNKEKIK